MALMTSRRFMIDVLDRMFPQYKDLKGVRQVIIDAKVSAVVEVTIVMFPDENDSNCEVTKKFHLTEVEEFLPPKIGGYE